MEQQIEKINKRPLKYETLERKNRELREKNKTLQKEIANLMHFKKDYIKYKQAIKAFESVLYNLKKSGRHK